MAQRKEIRDEGRDESREEQAGSLSAAADRAQEGIQRLENAFGAFWGEAAGEDAQPFVRHVARANMELMGLVGRRTRAMAELPARLVACQTPQDLWSEQMQFLRHSMSDFTSATDRIMEAISASGGMAMQQTEQTRGDGAQGRGSRRGSRE